MTMEDEVKDRWKDYYGNFLKGNEYDGSGVSAKVSERSSWSEVKKDSDGYFKENERWKSIRIVWYERGILKYGDYSIIKW